MPIDPYLEHVKQDDPNVKYPFLVRINVSEKASFDKLVKRLKKNGSLEITSNIGSVYACRAIWKAIEQLAECSAVINIEASRPAGRMCLE